MGDLTLTQFFSLNYDANVDHRHLTLSRLNFLFLGRLDSDVTHLNPIPVNFDSRLIYVGGAQHGSGQNSPF